jgi:hypothetical protein
MLKLEFRFQFWLFTFDEIEILTKLHTDFFEILMSKLDFQFWFQFWHRNSDSDLDFGIGILIPTSKFKFWCKISIQMSKFQSICHLNKSKILFWLLVRNSILAVEIEIAIPILPSIISSKVGINFEQNSDEINFGGNPSEHIAVNPLEPGSTFFSQFWLNFP